MNKEVLGRFDSKNQEVLVGPHINLSSEGQKSSFESAVDEETNLQNFHIWASSYLESIYINPNQAPEDISDQDMAEHWAHNQFDLQISKYASRIFDDTKSGKGFLYSGTFKKHFLHILNNFIHNKVNQGSELPKVEKMLSYLATHDFNHSNSFDGMSSIDLIKLSVELNNNPVMRGYMGQSVNDTLVYQLAFYEGDMNVLLKKTLDTATEPQRLGILYQLPTIAAKSLATSSWSESAFDGITDFLKKEIEDTTIPVLEQLIIKNGLEQLAKEYNNPTQSFLTYQGNQQAGRMSDQISHVDFFDEKINPSIALASGSHIVRVSADQLSIVDSTNLPQFYHRLNNSAEDFEIVQTKNKEETLLDFSLEASGEIISVLENGLPTDVQFKKRLYEYLRNAYQGENWGDYVHSLSSKFSEDDVMQLDKTEDIFAQIQEKHQEYIQKTGNSMSKENIDYEFSEYDLDALNSQAFSFLNNFPFLEVQRRVSVQVQKKKENMVSVEFSAYYDTSNNTSGYFTKEDYMQLQFLQRPDIIKYVSEYFYVDVRELTTHEQLYFLNYLKHTTIAEAETMQNFTSLYGVTGMRTFLSLEHGDESLGDKIVAFGQHEDVARRVFAYYGELLDSADSAEQLVREFIQSEENELDVIEQVRANILNRAQRDLVKAVQSDDVALIRGKLDTYTVGAKEYVALLQEVGTGNIENIKGGNLSNDDKTQMTTLLRSNYGTAYPHKEDTDFRKAVAGSLEEHLDDPNTSFRILYDGAKIVSFNRFDTRTDTQTNREVAYFGSFNAAAPYSGVGGVMLERTIQEQLQGGHAMFAHCDPTQAISMKYIEDGFIATDVYDIAGKESFEIWRSDTSSESVSSKQMSIKELLEFKGTDIIVHEQKEDEMYQEIKSGRALTRFFVHEGKTYLVFETLSDELRSSFQDVYTIDTIAAE